MKQVVLSIAAASTIAIAFPQGGPLTPPAGAPGPTMKTLDEIEPRIPLLAGSPGVAIDATGGITISQSGSYYLTANLMMSSASSDGIRVQASGVTVDLGGYSIIFQGEGFGADGIHLSGSNVTIQNGHVVSTTTMDDGIFGLGGFRHGVYGTGANTTVRDLTVRGAREAGILFTGSGALVEASSVSIIGVEGIVNSNGVVESCTVRWTGGPGIVAATVVGCDVRDTMGIAIFADTVADSTGRINSASESTATGIYASIVKNSEGISPRGDGIRVSQIVVGSYGQSLRGNIGRGIVSVNGSVISSVGKSAGGHGIQALNVISSNGSSSGGQGDSSSGIFAGGRVHGSYGIATASGGGPGISGGFLVSCPVTRKLRR